MGKESLIVSLQKLGNPEKILQKGVRDCEKRTFENVLDYMVDPKEDQDNPAYDAESRAFSQDIERMRKVEGQEKFSLMYLDANNNLSSPVTDYQKTIGDYQDAIAERKSPTQSGEEISYNGVNLVVDIETTGGR